MLKRADTARVDGPNRKHEDLPVDREGRER